MAENTQSARCTEAEFKAAREAGLMVFTTADEVAIHKFAEAIRRSAEPVYLEVSAPVMRGRWLRVDQKEFDEYTGNGWQGRALHCYAAA